METKNMGNAVRQDWQVKEGDLDVFSPHCAIKRLNQVNSIQLEKCH